MEASAAVLWATRTKAGPVAARCLLALAVTLSPHGLRAQEPPPATPPPASQTVASPEPPRTPPAEAGETRLFFAPTARSLPSGKGALGLAEIAFPWAEVGIVDRVSVLGFVVPPLGDLGGGVVVEPKVQLLRQARIQAAAGVVQGFGAKTGGIGYGVVTVGSADAAVTVGYGYGYGKWVDSEGSPGVWFLGAEKALGHGFRLVAEGYVGGEALGLPDQTLIGAVRFRRGSGAVGLGVLVPFYPSGSGTPFPLLDVAWSF